MSPKTGIGGQTERNWPCVAACNGVFLTRSWSIYLFDSLTQAATGGQLLSLGRLSGRVAACLGRYVLSTVCALEPWLCYRSIQSMRVLGKGRTRAGASRPHRSRILGLAKN